MKPTKEEISVATDEMVSADYELLHCAVGLVDSYRRNGVISDNGIEAFVKMKADADKAGVEFSKLSEKYWSVE